MRRLGRRYGRSARKRDERPYHVVFSTANGAIRGWVWATSARQAKTRLEDELGGAAFRLISLRVDPSGRAPHPHEREHSSGSAHFVREL